MTDAPAAMFQGTFSDLRIVKGRKVGQFVIEVPLEAVDHALKALGGVPRPDKEVWVVVARLDPKAVQRAPEKPEAKKQLTLSQESALRCDDKRFQAFLVDQHSYNYQSDFAAAVRHLCEVKSRAEFDTDPEAAQRWRELEGQYRAWQKEG